MICFKFRQSKINSTELRKRFQSLTKCIFVFMSIKREIIETSDGSKTIHLTEWNENYHSHHGALQEAKHVFLKNGLDDYIDQKHISILEVGLGTGLNAILTCQKATASDLDIQYAALEAYPVSPEELEALNYESLLDDELARSQYRQMHSLGWNQEHIISNNFSIHKIHDKLEEYTFGENQFDIIYFDAFGPRVQGELWSLEIFQKLFASLKINGLLVTYCAKGQVKRDLKAAGFMVECVPGPPGKREMTKAFKRDL
jgi:tRNA U34 5-methylaminomethyl-2-thiouridine-forming methyltransferase MnmC